MTGAFGASEPIALAGRAMGTTWSVKFVQPAVPLAPEEMKQRVAARLARLEAIFSTYRDDSELTRFNSSPGTGWTRVSPELALLAERAGRISELTGGAFDVTVDPLVRMWGFGPAVDTPVPPGKSEIAAARLRVDWRSLESRAEPPALRRMKSGLTADFSSLAKGYAADAIGAELQASGCPDYFVQVGGDVKTGGRAADGTAWRAGIEEPRDGAREIACVLHLSGQALSTSGDYRNYFVEGGRRYGHIIDPRTGSPVQGDLAAVSVVDVSCATSSALATALFVLGAESGLALARENGLAALFFVRNGERMERRMTPAFEKFMQ